MHSWERSILHPNPALYTPLEQFLEKNITFLETPRVEKRCFVVMAGCQLCVIFSFVFGQNNKGAGGCMHTSRGAEWVWCGPTNCGLFIAEAPPSVDVDRREPENGGTASKRRKSAWVIIWDKGRVDDSCCCCCCHHHHHRYCLEWKCISAQF
ncbi:hypothetical protein IWX49DRAFT_57190 [Phyllosticta citricarpa]